jgi:anaerobic dimethyl sulfoxide reductase subunit B (iron-sulfur subunit)
MPSLPTPERVLGFKEVELGYNADMAVAEAKRCLNCAGHLCRDVCPYNAPQFGAEERPKMQKCDLCLDRWTENKKPICVDACPMRALDAGPLDEMEEVYSGVKEAIGFESSREIAPSVVFKPSSRRG